MSAVLEPLLAAVNTAPVVPVLVIPEASAAAPLAEALLAGGLAVAEVTLRTPAGAEAIAIMKKTCPELVVGAGTVLNGMDVSASLNAGADFLVSPGMSTGLLEALGENRKMMIPGTSTVSEAMSRHEEGFEVLKLFPAEISGGVAALKAIAGPLPHLRFMPTGGVSASNVSDYLALPNVVAIGGSWIATADDISTGNWAGITSKAKAALAAA